MFSRLIHLRRVFIPLFCIHLVLMAAAIAQTGVPASHLKHLRRGLNIGRFSDHLENDRCCTCCGPTDDIPVIKSKGFDHVRIIVKPQSMADFSKPITMIGGKSLEDLDKIVQKFLDQQLGVILAITIDKDDGQFKDISERFGKATSPFDDYLASFWNLFAKHYSSSDLVFFESLSEPQLDGTTWSGLQGKLVTAIRAGAGQNTILASGAGGILTGLLALDPLPDKNIGYIFHYYEPYSFTNQGETWADSYAQSLASGKVKYPYTLQSAQEAARSITNLSQQLNAMHDMESATKDRIETDIDEIAKWKQNLGVTVVCDEFGVIRSAPGADRVDWIKDVRELLERNGIGWTFWDYSSNNFGLSAAPNQFDEKAVSALFGNAPPVAR